MQKTKSVCFVSPQAYPILAQTNHQSAGGAEVQQVLIAKELKKYEFNISFVVGNYGTNAVEIVDGIRLIKSSSGYRGGKLNYIPTLFALFAALCKTNAETYFLRSPKHLLGVVGFYCQLRRKKLIFSSSINYDSNSKHIRRTESIISRTLYFLGLRWTDVVIAQSNHQRKQFKENFRLDATVIKNLQPLPSLVPEKPVPPIVLWVGTACERKRPKLFLYLAKAVFWGTFRMITAPGQEESLINNIKEKAEKIPNLEYLGFVPYYKINEHFAQASILVSTSRWEGFPNVFLQAWAYKIPVVSLEVDPDECICKNRLGFHSKTFNQIVKDVKLLLEDDNLRKEMGINARRYVERDHNVKKTTSQYVRLLKSL